MKKYIFLKLVIISNCLIPHNFTPNAFKTQSHHQRFQPQAGKVDISGFIGQNNKIL